MRRDRNGAHARHDPRRPCHEAGAREGIEALREGNKTDWIIVLALCIVGAILGQIQNVALDGSKVDIVTLSVRGLVAPPTRVVNATIAFVADFFVGVRDAHELRQENDRLKAVEQSAMRYQETYDELFDRYKALREQVDYPLPSSSTKIFARVVSFIPFQNRLTLDRGSSHGIGPHMAVVSAKGLVGIIETVTPQTSQVLLVSSPAIRVAVKVIGDTDVPGIAKGETPTRIAIDLLQSDVVHTGETVVTSGFSTTIPSGIFVGTVVDARMDEQFGTQRVYVLPAFDIGEVTEVFVVK